MTQSLESMFSFTPWWLPVVTILILSTVLFLICYFLPYDEYAQPIKQPKPRKLTLIDWFISILIFTITIGLIVWILFIIGNKLAIATIDCANCTGLLSWLALPTPNMNIIAFIVASSLEPIIFIEITNAIWRSYQLKEINPMRIYQRICERCNKLFKATGKFCTICTKCQKPCGNSPRIKIRIPKSI